MNIVGDVFSDNHHQCDDEDLLLDASMFYADDSDFFLPDFSLSSCMSSLSSNTTSSSSSSSSTTTTTTVIKSCDAQDYAPPPPQPSQQTQLLSSTASMEIPQPLDGMDGGDCCTMDTFDDALLLFQNDERYTSLDEELAELEQKQQKQCEALMRWTDEDDDQDMSSVFLEWLKMNKESVSASELRRVRLKKSTIECAVKRLGGGKEGMKQLLKLVLHWVQTNHLPTKTHKPNLNNHDNIINFTSPPPPPPPPLSMIQQPTVVGYSGYPYPNTSVPKHDQYPYPYYNGMRLGGSVSAATKEARRKRMARQRLSHSHYHHHYRHHQHQEQINHANNNDDLGGGGGWSYWPPAPPHVPACRGGAEADMQTQQQGRISTEQHRRVLLQGCKPEKNLRFLLHKVLKQSDVGNLGRIVLPKKEAETHLPELEARDGICIAMEDIGTSRTQLSCSVPPTKRYPRVWNMRYRYWPNNKSRMYLLENTGDFVRANGLQEGDFIVIYSEVKCGKYMIRGVKVRQAGAKSETKKGEKSQKYRNGNNINDVDDASPFSPKTTDQTQKNEKISKC